MKLIVDEDKIKDLAGKALDSLIRSGKDQPMLLLLSGGSSLGLLDHVQEDSFNGNLTVGMLDDRYSREEGVNSYGLLKATGFYLKGLRRGTKFLDSSVGEFETLEAYAARYEGYIKKWLKQYPNGVIRATIGIGPDGHTSGVLPHPENPKKFNELFNGEKLIVGYDVGEKNPHRYRMTSTFTLMRKFDKVLTYMTGENKKDALKKVKKEKGNIAENPGRIIREFKDVEVYTDIKV